MDTQRLRALLDADVGAVGVLVPAIRSREDADLILAAVAALPLLLDIVGAADDFREEHRCGYQCSTRTRLEAALRRLEEA